MIIDYDDLMRYCRMTFELNGLWKDYVEEITTVEMGFVSVKLTVPRKASNIYGNAFGGYLSSAVDLVGSSCASTTEKHVVTQSTDLHFIRSLKVGQTFVAEARVVHNGRTSIIVEVRLKDPAADKEHELCVSATLAMYAVTEMQPHDELVYKILELGDKAEKKRRAAEVGGAVKPGGRD